MSCRVTEAVAELRNETERAMRTERQMSCSETGSVPSLNSGDAHHRAVGHGGGAGQSGQKVDVASNTLSEVVSASTSLLPASGSIGPIVLATC